MTILLSLTVFLNLVAESMPTTSDAVPLIGTYYKSNETKLSGCAVFQCSCPLSLSLSLYFSLSICKYVYITHLCLSSLERSCPGSCCREKVAFKLVRRLESRSDRSNFRSVLAPFLRRFVEENGLFDEKGKVCREWLTTTRKRSKRFFNGGWPRMSKGIVGRRGKGLPRLHGEKRF